MEIRFNRELFLKSLVLGSSCAGKSVTLPILGCVRLKFGNGKGIISSFNGEVSVMRRVSIESNFSEVIEFCVDAKDLLSALRSLSDEYVSFELSGTTVRILHERGVIELPFFDASEFPTLSSGSDGNSFIISAVRLREWIRNSMNFCLDDQFKPQLSGMYLYHDSDCYGVCSSDGVRLFADEVKMDGLLDGVSAIVSCHAFSSLMSLLNDVEEVGIVIDDKNISFNVTDACLSCRLIEARYPNFKSIIPHETPIYVTFDKDELKEAVNRVTMFADATSAIVLSVIGDKVEIASESLEFSRRTKEELSVEHTGDDIRIGFNGKFLMNCLNAIDAERVRFCLTSPERGALLLDAENPLRSVLCFPMQIA